MSPLPSTRVIPAGWSAHHARAALGAMNATCDLYGPAPTGGVWNEDTGTYEPTPHTPLHAGKPCRVQKLAPSGAVEAAGEEVQASEYLIQVDARLDLTGVVRVVVTDGHAGSPGAYAVDHTGESSEAFTRDLFCTRTS